MRPGGTSQSRWSSRRKVTGGGHCGWETMQISPPQKAAQKFVFSPPNYETHFLTTSLSVNMASSRIFVRGLPPTMTEEEFKKHFGAKYSITDAKLFPQRRIGYIGYNTPDDAEEAVKYFHRTFIRMSKIGVELARPVRCLAHFQPRPSC